MDEAAPIRLAAWNCRQRVDAKRHAFDLLGADVVVVPECSAAPAVARELGVSFLWHGTWRPKGLGVFGLRGWRIEPLVAPLELPWILPLRVARPDNTPAFDLLAVWTRTPGGAIPGYARQVAALIDVWGEHLASGTTVVAGDLNCSLQGPSRRAHLANLAALERLGLQSCYHVATGCAHGEESAMTLRWAAPGGVRKEYHCDFILLPQRLQDRVTSVEIGSMEAWVESGLSDHCPVIVNLTA